MVGHFVTKWPPFCSVFEWSGPFENRTMASLGSFIYINKFSLYIKRPRLKQPFWKVHFSNGWPFEIQTKWPPFSFLPFINRTLKRSVFKWSEFEPPLYSVFKIVVYIRDLNSGLVWNSNLISTIPTFLLNLIVLSSSTHPENFEVEACHWVTSYTRVFVCFLSVYLLPPYLLHSEGEILTFC